jgi:hypothetical protein
MTKSIYRHTTHVPKFAILFNLFNDATISITRSNDKISQWSILKSGKTRSWPIKNTGWSRSLCAPDNYSIQCIRTIPTQSMSWRWPSHSTSGMWTVLYWTRSSRTLFGVSINVWRLPGGTLNIICNFPYCIHQVHTDFLITCTIRTQ